MHYVFQLSGDFFGLKTFSGTHGVIKIFRYSIKSLVVSVNDSEIKACRV